MQYKDYYKILGVERDASLDKIKRAYRKLAHKYHPDVSREPDAEAKFKEINEAHEVLRDPEKRAAYDQMAAYWQSGQGARPSPEFDDFGAHFSWNAEARGGNFSDFFESLFGQEFGATPHARAHDVGAAGQDQHAKISISLEDAFHGASRTIELATPVRGRQGAPATSYRKLKVKIPAGISDGQKIRLAGQGAPGRHGQPRGDLLLEVNIKPHPLYTVTGKDVYLDLPITPSEAALGATITTPTLGGPVSLKIPAGSQSGDKLRLKGRGLPGKPPGDQYVVLLIQVPRRMSEQGRQAYQRLREEAGFNPRADLVH